MTDTTSTTARVEIEISMGWAGKNPDLFVATMQEFEQDYPEEVWSQTFDMSRKGFIKLIAHRKDDDEHQRHARIDAALHGTGYLVDGLRVHPERVTVIKQEDKPAAPQNIPWAKPAPPWPSDADVKVMIQRDWKASYWGLMDCDRCSSGRGKKFGNGHPCDGCKRWPSWIKSWRAGEL